MKRKRIVSIILASFMGLASLTGCSGSSGSGSQETSSSAENNAPDKLTALVVKHSLTKDVEEMEWMKEIEKEANVEIEWQQISADWDQKKGALFGSGEIPDLLIYATNQADYIQFNGLFEDWTPWIEQYGDNIKVMFEEHPETKIMATSSDGKIYGLPSYNQKWANTWPMFINKTWLDNLGLEMPTTWAELEEVLIAFKEKDANGNGDTTDEIPMDCTPMPDVYSPIHLLGSLGVPLSEDSTSGYFAEDGVVKSIYTDDRFKEVLKFVRGLWSKGLINNEMFTQDYSKYQSVARGDGDVAKVGFTWGWVTSDRFGEELKDQYVSLPQLKYSADQDESEVTWMNCNISRTVGANKVAMSANCENKEAAIRFVDLFYNEVNSMQCYFGGMNDTEKCIGDNGDGTYTVLPPADESMDPGTWRWTNALSDNGFYYLADDIKLTLGEDTKDVQEQRLVYQEALERVTGDSIYPQMFMKYSAEDTNTLSMNQANIDNITSQQLAAWITGEGDIDSEWDGFVESIKNAGLTQNLEIRQAAFDEYLSTQE